jgi:hypothetical protein
MKRLSHVRKLLAVSALLIATATPADTYCTGLVTSELMFSDGGVLLNPVFRGDWIEVCNIHGTWNGIAGDVCMEWYAAIVAAKIHGNAIGIYYAGTNIVCSTLGTYSSSPVPYYVRLHDTP